MLKKQSKVKPEKEKIREEPVPPVPSNSPITYKGKTFRLFMTSRGPQKADGRLRALEHIPEHFHSMITLVTGAEHEKALRKNYPNLADFWKTPRHIDSAAKKRRLIMSSYEEDYAILINDDVTIHCFDEKTKRMVRPTEKLFKMHLKNFMDLAMSEEGFGGLSLHDRAFSKQTLDKKMKDLPFPDAYVVRTRFIGAFFCIKKKIVRSDLFHLGRLNYYEDIDYSLQLLKLGFNTCQYLGMVFSHPSTKPTPWHSDRTFEVRDRDRERLISFFPEAVRKRPPDKLREDLNIDIYVKYSEAYKNAPKKRRTIQ